MSPHAAHGMAVAATMAAGGPFAQQQQQQQGATEAPSFIHRGFCFAEFSDHESAHRALKALVDPAFTRIPSGTTATNAAPASSGGGGGNLSDGALSDGGGSGNAASASPDAPSLTNALKVDWAEPLHEVSEVRFSLFPLLLPPAADPVT